MKSQQLLSIIAVSCFSSLFNTSGLAADIVASEKVEISAMVKIPAGSYVPLYSAEKISREVESFYIDKTPVTNRQYLAFVTENPDWQRSRVSKLFADKSYLKNWLSDTELGDEVSADAPVTNISWFAARAFAEFYHKRLPTVDEWEYVARANAVKVDATKDSDYTKIILDWYAKKPAKMLASAEKYEPNVYGVHAMHGLVWEWNEDFNNAMVTGESRGDSGIERNLYCAGGALSASDVSNYAAFMRFAFRSSLKGSYTTSSLGFRCAKDLKNND